MSKLPVHVVPTKDPISPTMTVILTLIQGLLPAMTAIVGGLWIVFSYMENQAENARRIALQTERENTSRLLDSRKPFLDKQLAVYVDLAQTVGVMVASYTDTDKYSRANERFYNIYYSELVLVADNDVIDSANEFHTRLQKFDSLENEHNRLGKDQRDQSSPDQIAARQALQEAAVNLNYSMSRSIRAGWNVEKK